MNRINIFRHFSNNAANYFFVLAAFQVAAPFLIDIISSMVGGSPRFFERLLPVSVNYKFPASAAVVLMVGTIQSIFFGFIVGLIFWKASAPQKALITLRAKGRQPSSKNISMICASAAIGLVIALWLMPISVPMCHQCAMQSKATFLAILALEFLGIYLMSAVAIAFFLESHSGRKTWAS